MFLPVTFVICCITSLATGTSFGTIGTVGLALMSIGLGLGVPSAMTAGAIASGAFFGDKMSPLSDTTNVAPAIAGTDLFKHIGSMLWTTVPAAVISFGLYWFIGRDYGAGQVNWETVNEIRSTLAGTFSLGAVTLIPAVLVILLSVFRIPAGDPDAGDLLQRPLRRVLSGSGVQGPPGGLHAWIQQRHGGRHGG